MKASENEIINALYGLVAIKVCQKQETKTHQELTVSEIKQVLDEIEQLNSIELMDKAMQLKFPPEKMLDYVRLVSQEHPSYFEELNNELSIRVVEILTVASAR